MIPTTRSVLPFQNVTEERHQLTSEGDVQPKGDLRAVHARVVHRVDEVVHLGGPALRYLLEGVAVVLAGGNVHLVDAVLIQNLGEGARVTLSDPSAEIAEVGYYLEVVALHEDVAAIGEAAPDLNQVSVMVDAEIGEGFLAEGPREVGHPVVRIVVLSCDLGLQGRPERVRLQRRRRVSDRRGRWRLLRRDWRLLRRDWSWRRRR